MKFNLIKKQKYNIKILHTKLKKKLIENFLKLTTDKRTNYIQTYIHDYLYNKSLN